MSTYCGLLIDSDFDHAFDDHSFQNAVGVVI